MNERIRQIAEQATSIQGPTPYNPLTFEVFDKEKFAQLLVRECAVYCEGHILPKGMAEENDLDYNDGVMDCAIGLKTIFGIE
jgi:hypothetical protein